jgi:outer membrane protein assembly factor BamA
MVTRAHACRRRTAAARPLLACALACIVGYAPFVHAKKKKAPPVEIEVVALADDEEERLQGYLKGVVDPGEAERRLLELGAYKRAACDKRDLVHIRCKLTRARVLRDVRVDGLPLALLESDLKKRVFLVPGEPLDEDEASGKSRLGRQRQRIEEFLEREGFIGAQVRLLVQRVNDAGDHDVLIRIRGGAFPTVRRVDLAEWGPLSQKELEEAYGAMCWSSEGFLDGAFLGRLACYNKRRLQATTETFLARLIEEGYPEARVRAVPVFIDAAHSEDPECARTVAEVDAYKDNGLKVPPLCVDIKVEVHAGKKVTARFHSKGAPIARTPTWLAPGTLLWLRETLLEPVSRGFDVVARGRPDEAEDTRLVEQRLKESLSFESAASADETEIEISAESVAEYLGKRGYVAPQVTVDHRTYEDELVVDFRMKPGRVGAVTDVRFVGNKTISTREIEKNVELAARPRAWDKSGTLSPAQLADDEARIRDYYEDRGFAEANVTSRASIDDMGGIHVVFSIEEGDRFVVQNVLLVGGAPAMAADVLASLKHCEGGLASVEDRKPETGADCAGAPLRVDELEADAQRVQNAYASHGYPNVEAVVDTAFTPKGTDIRVTVLPPDADEAERADPKVDNVKPVRVGEVFVVGNEVTRRDVILREVGLDAADEDGILDPIQIQKGVSRLRRTGLYQSVDLQYLGLDDPGGRAHVRIGVDERPAFTVDTSVGFSTERLWSLRLDIRHKNVLGSMFDVDALGDFGLFIGRYSQGKIAVRWPRILGSDVSASLIPIAVTYSDEPAGARLSVPASPAGQKIGAAWLAPDERRRLFSVGGSFALDWRLNDVHEWVDNKLVLGLGFELRYDWLDASSPYVPPASWESLVTGDGLKFVFRENENNVAVPVKASQVAALTPRVAYTNVDNPFDPKEGWAAEAFFRAAIPPLVPQFFGVLGLSGRGYYTIWERLTFAGGARLRTGFATDVSESCPEGGCEWALMQNDLLRLGGERSVRGVPEGQIGVFGPLYDQQLAKVTDPKGNQIAQVHPGLYSGVVNLEVRYTLVKQLFLGDLKVAGFFDGGMSTNDFNFETNPDPEAPADFRYATGIGAGLRYVMPVGPLSLDVAYSPQRRTYNFYVIFGYVF